MTAIMLAKARGVEVYATASTEAKAEACRKAGAVECFLYTNPDKPWDSELKKYSKGGVDAILDMVGGDYLQKNINVLKNNGRLCVIGFVKSPQSQVDMTRVLFKQLHITGSALRAQSNELKSKLAKEVQENVFPLLENGTIKPVVNTVFPDISGAAAAHSEMESSRHTGKIILKVNN